MGNTYGYIRVSSRDQNEDRQIDAMNQLKTDQLQSSLIAVILPQDPGEPPVYGKLPNREDFYKDARKNKAQSKVQTAAAVFPAFRAMWKEFTRTAVGDKVYFGKFVSCSCYIRPALWINLESDIF